MIIKSRKTIRLTTMFLAVCLAGGCGKPFGAAERQKDLASTEKLGDTIGSLTKAVTPQPIAVEGYGLVGGLNGTGSTVCPEEIRAYLVRYILAQLPARKVNPDEFIASPDTAVVRITGAIPAMPLQNEYFDVKVTALAGTETTSLDGGWLYLAELKPQGTFGIVTKVIANVEGPVFIDKIDANQFDTRTGYILGGAKVLEDYVINLEFVRPDFTTTNQIRNRLNERFGYNTARAASASRIELRIPARYIKQKQRFIEIVNATYVSQTPETTKERISTYAARLASAADKQESEIALEAIGSESLGELTVLLSSPDEQVRFRAARCMLNLGSEQGFFALSTIASDRNSAYRLNALEAIGAAAKQNDVATISQRLLLDENFDVKLAAYENLRNINDSAVARELIERNFFLEQVARSKDKVIFVSRSEQPRIVIFGAPISCHPDIFIQSADGTVVINAPAGQEYVSLIRRHPKRPSAIAQLKSSFDLADIIRTLGREPVKETEQGRPGLGLSYADVILLLKQMCEKSAITAQFRAGPLLKIE